MLCRCPRIAPSPLALMSTSDPFDNLEPSTTSILPIQITNSISLVACICVIITYAWFRRHNSRLLERTSLVLALAMTISDGLLHIINLFGYSDLPHNAICAIFGGFFYAFPTLVSIFYSVCIALNTQLVFVFSKRPDDSSIKYYLGVPILLSLCICVPALATGVYGFDESWSFCWIATDGRTRKDILVRYILTFGFWCLASILYLIIAALSITFAVFSANSRLNRLASGLSHHPDKAPNEEDHRQSFLPRVSPTGTLFWSALADRRLSIVPRRSETLSRRSLAMRALAFRLLGYIMIPMFCILPGVIKDLVSKVNPTAIENLPSQATTFFDTLNGFVGLFNAILFALDPALLALYRRLRTEKEERVEVPLQDANAGSERSPSIAGSVVPPQLETPQRVQVRPGKYLTPIAVGDMWTKAKSQWSPTSPTITGIVVRVDVEIVDDLERLGDYLGGL